MKSCEKTLLLRRIKQTRMNNRLPFTFLLTLLVAGALLGLHFLPSPSVGGKPLRRVDMLADIRPDAEPAEACDSDTLLLPPPAKPLVVDTCLAGMTCIEDYADSTRRGMSHFYEILSQAETLDRPVRVACFGDSFIEADIFTADLRALLQEAFGGCGVGYVPITSSVSNYRPTVGHRFEGWSSHSPNDSIAFDKARQGISGHYFFPGEGAYVQLKGQSKYAARLDTCEVSTLYFLSSDTVSVRSAINGEDGGELHEAAGGDELQCFAAEGRIGQIRWSVEQADSAVFYGVAMDGRRGVCVDNFSVRGSSGLNLNAIPLRTLRGFHRLRPYDLVVLQYGLNVASETRTDYDGYKQGMLRVIEHLKAAFPEAGILLVSVGDREYKDEGELRTMPGIKNLVRYQQSIAADGHVAFWNLYAAMGGEGSIVEMAGRKMAGLDYTHINFKGGKHLAGLLFDTMMYGKEQYEKRKAYDAD